MNPGVAAKHGPGARPQGEPGGDDLLRVRRDEEARRLEGLLREQGWCSDEQLALARKELAGGAGVRLEHALRRLRALSDHQIAHLHAKLGWRISVCPECEAPINVAGLPTGSHACPECGERVRLDPSGDLVRGDTSRPSRRKALAALEVESFLVLSTAIERRLLTASDVYGLVERFGLGPQVVQELAHQKKLDAEEMAALCKLARADGLLEPEMLGRAGRLIALEGAEHPARPDLRLALETATQSIERLGFPLSAKDREELVLARLVAKGHLTPADRRICESLAREDAAAGRSLPLYRYALRANRLEESVLDRVLAEVASELGDAAALAQPPSQVRADAVSREGNRFAGYRLIRRLGRGGMGTVYLVEDASGRQLALKTLRSEGAATARQIRRFRVEAEAVGRLDHPGIIKVVDTGLEEDVHFFTMEFVDGPTLAHLIDAGQLSQADRIELLARVCDALHHAHGHQVLHRDLKPSNILVDAAGQPKLMDFGLAKMLDSEGTRLTRSGDAVGTPSYMPPEQVAGSLGELSPASDTYSCGVLLYQLLCGRLPFVGATAMELYFRILEGHAAPPSRHSAGISPDLDRVCLKALARDPRDRYSTALAFATDLRRVMAGRRPSARPPGPFLRTARRLARIELRHGLGAAVVIGTALIVADLLMLTRRTADALRRRRAEQTRYQAANLVEQGEVALELRQLEAARFRFQQAAALEAHPRAWAGLAALDLEAGRLAQAEWRARVAQACQPDQARHLTLLGRIAEARGDPDGALADYDAALAIDRSEVGALGRRAALMRARGNVDRALADEAAREGPVRVRVAGFLAQARSALDHGDTDVAVEHARRAIALTGEHAEAWYVLARCAVAQGQPDLALEQLALAIARAPGEPRYALAEGRLLERAGRMDEALRAYERASAVAGAGSAPYELARCMVERGDAAGAARALARAAPSHAPARYLALEGQLALLVGDRGRACESARAALAADPEDSDALLLTAELAEPDGLETVVARLERWVEGEPPEARARALLALGAVELRRARPARALAHFTAAASAGGDGAELDRLIAEAALGASALEDAGTRAERAVARGPGDARAWSTLARVRLATGDPAGARAAAACAQRLTPEAGIDPELSWTIAYALRDFDGLEALAASVVAVPSLGRGWGDAWDAAALGHLLDDGAGPRVAPAAAGPVDPLLVAAHLRALAGETPAADLARRALVRRDDRFRSVVEHELSQLGPDVREVVRARLPSPVNEGLPHPRAWILCLARAVVAGEDASLGAVRAWGSSDDRVLGAHVADSTAVFEGRRLAARGLAMRAGLSAAAAGELRRLRGGVDSTARVLAGWELARLGDVGASPAIAELGGIAAPERAALVGASADRSWLLRELGSDDARVAWEAALALVALGEASGVTVLRRLASGVEEWRRAEVPRALAAGADTCPEAHAWLVGLTMDPSPKVARRAVVALVSSRRADTLAALVDVARGTDPIAARWASVGLARAAASTDGGPANTALGIAARVALAPCADERAFAGADQGPVWLRGIAILRTGSRCRVGTLSPDRRVVAALSSPFPELRAAGALAHARWPWCEAALRVRLAVETDPGVRVALGAVMGRWLRLAERPEWVASLGPLQDEARRGAARALVRAGYGRSSLELAYRLAPAEPAVREAWESRREE